MKPEDFTALAAIAAIAIVFISGMFAFFRRSASGPSAFESWLQYNASRTRESEDMQLKRMDYEHERFLVNRGIIVIDRNTGVSHITDRSDNSGGV